MVKLTPDQEKHGYVEACTDAILAQKWVELHVDLDDVQKWDVDQPPHHWWFMKNPAPLAVRIANDLAAHATVAGRPSLAIPAERIAGDIYYTLGRKTALTNEGKYSPRKLRSDASKQAKRDLAAAGL